MRRPRVPKYLTTLLADVSLLPTFGRLLPGPSRRLCWRSGSKADAASRHWLATTPHAASPLAHLKSVLWQAPEETACGRDVASGVRLSSHIIDDIEM